MKQFVNRRTAAMQDFKDLSENAASSTAPSEEAEPASSPAIEVTDLVAAEAPNAEASSAAESAHRVEALGDASATVELSAPEEAADETSGRAPSGTTSETPSLHDAAKREAADETTHVAPRIDPPRATLIPFVAPQPKSPPLGRFGRFATDRRFQTGAAAACLALVALATGGATLQARSQGESQRIAEAVSTLSARLDAIEAAKPRDEAAEIRKAVAEARGGLASSRDLTATVAGLNTRLDRLEREQQARLDKLGDHLEHDAATRSADAQARGADLAARVEKLEKTDVAARVDRLEKADLAGRVDKLEKADVVARIDKVEKKMQTAAAQPAAAPLPPQKEAAATTAVSNDITGSIEKPHPSDPIRGWYLVEMRNGSAIVDNRQRAREIAPGDVLPGAGKVERFERRGREWVVVTEQGIIVQAPPGSYAPRVVLRPPMYGPYGGFGPGYGGYED